MNKIILILIIFFTSTNTYSQTPTLLGLHGVFTPNIANQLGAQVVRYGFADYKIKNVFLSGGEAPIINKMMRFESLGIEQVVFLRWPDDTIEVVGTDFERIPTGADSTEVFQYLDTFLMAVGPYVDWIQINQEPLGATKYDHTKYTISEVIQWWRTVAGFIRAKQAAHPAELGHLKIMTGGITGIKGALDSPDAPIAAIIDSIIRFGENYCDAIDLHLHTSSVAEGTAEIEYITSRTNHPLATMEWSQSRASVDTGWLNDTNIVWMDSSDTYFGLTNAEVIGSAYETPMDTTDWNALIATSPYTDNFIPDYYSVLDSNCFIMACYAGVWQYGNPRFDWNQLIASKTVTATLYPNNPFNTEFVDLSAILNSGAYTTRCSLSAIEDETGKSNIEIYPNPASDMIYIEAGEAVYEAEIFDILGIQAARFTIDQKAAIDIRHLESGVYFIKFWDDTSVKALRFVKQ